jgi:cation diffusion facilitator family transporter
MGCCRYEGCGTGRLTRRQTAVLKRLLGINGAMFVVELAAGLAAGSVALLADSLDMLGDALVYGVSLLAVTRGERWKAGAALFKGAVMAGFGLFVLVKAVHGMLIPELPEVSLMGSVGLLALAANGLCLALLWRHRRDDVNMRSAWLCSRNDIVANVSVLGAAAAVQVLGSAWPDIAVGLALAALWLASSLGVMRSASRALAAARV